MIQSKNVEKQDNDDVLVKQAVNIPAEENSKGNTEKSIYKVYPVNTPPIKLDVIENNKKESVVIGTRAEPPLPPSKINTEFQNPLFDPKDRNDAPVLKPHPRPSTYPIKSDFPYPLERPDSSMNHPAVPETPSKNGNDLEEPDYFSNNQWNTMGKHRIQDRNRPQSQCAESDISHTEDVYRKTDCGCLHPHRA
ncbi:hypothetical protein JTB14_016796 [Gonioctena quinquepunctata]|nr:hypothetical protein JTB14_016796 [Gonioctena quinquepunctata]